MRKYVTATGDSLTRVAPSALSVVRLHLAGSGSPVLERPVAALLLGEESLELRAKLLGGRQRRILGEQSLSRGASEGVVLLLHRTDDRADLRRLRDLPVDLGLGVADGRVETRDPQVEAGRALDVRERRGGRLRVRGLRQVVRHVYREAQRVVPALSEAELHQGAPARRHLNRSEPALVLLDQLGTGR